MQSTARVTSVLALAAAARALRPVPSRANPVPAAAPWKDGARALAKSGGKAVAAAGLALSFWPAASFAAEDLEIDEGLAATQAFLSSISKSGNVKKGSGKAAVPVGDSSLPDFGRAAPKETAPEIAAADSLLTKKDSLTGDIRESASERIGSEAPVVETNAPQPQKKRETPAWVTYKAPEPEPKEAPKPYEPAEPTFTITPKKDDASLKATGDFFASISKKVGKKGRRKAPPRAATPVYRTSARRAEGGPGGVGRLLRPWASKVQARYHGNEGQDKGAGSLHPTAHVHNCPLPVLVVRLRGGGLRR